MLGLLRLRLFEGAKLKPVLLDAILILEEKAIAETFPHGARLHKGKAGKPDRFSPVINPDKPDKSLKWLLREKRKRRPQKRLLGKTHGYTENPAHALRTRPDVGEAISEAEQREMSEEAEKRFDLSHEAVGRTDPSVYIARRAKNRAV